MKHVVYLIFFVIFSGCNSNTPKDLTKKPEPTELIGEWKLDLASYNAMMHYGYKCNDVRLTLNEDGSFETENFPNVINKVTKEQYADCQSIDGEWSIEKRFSKEKWAVLLKFDKYQIYGGNNLILFEVLMENKKLILRHSFLDYKDLNSEERLQFFKIEHQNSSR
ncbi:hypothetical protein DBB36_22730 [Flavobacterium sp. WLB]|uniref:hypothetical protein n=1 Tax=Flavobacterium sp. WLB TaxID=2161662 RepID=UPI000D352C95|nr:hypothetical protein [Flavobacterium sp. WLB]PUU67674.1 hypothetical protein DBB36_22730 [Flavobacterium sp. WLB]